jgi:hypothetical protein
MVTLYRRPLTKIPPQVDSPASVQHATPGKLPRPGTTIRARSTSVVISLTTYDVHLGPDHGVEGHGDAPRADVDRREPLGLRSHPTILTVGGAWEGARHRQVVGQFQLGHPAVDVGGDQPVVTGRSWRRRSW